jgi:hypothetical protein
MQMRSDSAFWVVRGIAELKRLIEESDVRHAVMGR